MQKVRAEIPARIEPFFELQGPNDLGPGLEDFRAPLPTAYFVLGSCVSLTGTDGFK
jgi:hypothetical protein